jgi:GT2 family glycosyltransferase
MEGATQTVSVVIPTHNRCDRLGKLLDALAAEPATEIVAVVNASNDGSLELLESRARDDPRLKPVAIPVASKTAALQAGIERATGNIVLMLDDDVVPQPGLVAGHARHHASKANTVVVGYMPIAPSSPRRRGQFPVDLYRHSYELVCCEYERDPGSILRGLWGGNVSLSREDVLRVGLDPAPTMPIGHWYHEDRDFGLRCAAAGLEGVFDRALLAKHEHRTTPETFLRIARDSGHTRWAIHAGHGETIGPLPEDFYERSVPMPGRLLVRLSRNRTLQGLIRPLLRAITTAAGRLHLFRLETHCGYVLGKIEQQRGALEAAAAAPAGRRAAA